MIGRSGCETCSCYVVVQLSHTVGPNPPTHLPLSRGGGATACDSVLRLEESLETRARELVVRPKGPDQKISVALSSTFSPIISRLPDSALRNRSTASSSRVYIFYVGRTIHSHGEQELALRASR